MIPHFCGLFPKEYPHAEFCRWLNRTDEDRLAVPELMEVQLQLEGLAEYQREAILGLSVHQVLDGLVQQTLPASALA